MSRPRPHVEELFCGSLDELHEVVHAIGPTPEEDDDGLHVVCGDPFHAVEQGRCLLACRHPQGVDSVAFEPRCDCPAERVSAHYEELRRWLAASANGAGLAADDGWSLRPSSTAKPRPLGDDAYHGIAGAVVRELEPHSEADPASLLVQLLVAAGNALGRYVPAYKVEADYHRGRLFTVIVGPTSRGRKGTSWGRIEHLMERVDRDWTDEHVLHGGLSTGEGLIQALNNYDSEEEDQQSGEVFVVPSDKRLLVLEPEFARVLKVAKREGSTISAVLRSLWDRDVANVATRNNPLSVKQAHLSVIGHITRSELRREISDVDILDGFANRFLFVYAERSKLLPFGGDIDDDMMASLSARLREAITEERHFNSIVMDEETRGEWVADYPALTAERPGLYGAATARAEAEVIRLAVIYALLDRTRLIRREHLRAALEVWRYCHDSARHIFGTRIGDTVADRVLAEIRDSQGGYMDRNEIREFLGHKIDSNRIDLAREALVELGHIDIEQIATLGRPRDAGGSAYPWRKGEERRERASLRRGRAFLPLSPPPYGGERHHDRPPARGARADRRARGRHPHRAPGASG
jgi:uncharacterized protein DUF3987